MPIAPFYLVYAIVISFAVSHDTKFVDRISHNAYVSCYDLTAYRGKGSSSNEQIVMSANTFESSPGIKILRL